MKTTFIASEVSTTLTNKLSTEMLMPYRLELRDCTSDTWKLKFSYATMVAVEEVDELISKLKEDLPTASACKQELIRRDIVSAEDALEYADIRLSGRIVNRSFVVYSSIGNSIMLDPTALTRDEAKEMIVEDRGYPLTSEEVVKLYGFEEDAHIGDYYVTEVDVNNIPSVVDIHSDYGCCHNHKMSDHVADTMVHVNSLVASAIGEYEPQCVKCYAQHLVEGMDIKKLFIGYYSDVQGIEIDQHEIPYWVISKYRINFCSTSALTKLSVTRSGKVWFKANNVAVVRDGKEKIFTSLFHARMFYEMNSGEFSECSPLVAHNNFVNSCDEINYTPDSSELTMIPSIIIGMGSDKIRELLAST